MKRKVERTKEKRKRKEQIDRQKDIPPQEKKIIEEEEHGFGGSNLCLLLDIHQYKL